MPNRSALLAPLLALLCSCADGPPDFSGQSNGGPVGHQPAKLWWDGALSIHAPDASGWRQFSAADYSVSFVHSVSDTESTGAQVSLFALTAADSQAGFEALVKAIVEQGAARNQQVIQSASYRSTDERGYACVRAHSVVVDAARRTARPLQLEAEALYCRHPVRTGDGFSAVFSHRGEKPDPELAADAEQFFSGVQVPGHEAAALSKP